MRVLADHGEHQVEADVRREGDTVTVRIGETEHVFRIIGEDNGRLELELDGGKVHVVEIVGPDLRVDGRPFALTARKAPPHVPGAMRGAGGPGGATSVKPPMPGKIVKVAVSAGDHVQPGEVLVILEAMKMQNEIVSPIEGTVKSVGVKEGESIDSKRVICEIE